MFGVVDTASSRLSGIIHSLKIDRRSLDHNARSKRFFSHERSDEVEAKVISSVPGVDEMWTVVST